MEEVATSNLQQNMSGNAANSRCTKLSRVRDCCIRCMCLLTVSVMLSWCCYLFFDYQIPIGVRLEISILVGGNDLFKIPNVCMF